MLARMIVATMVSFSTVCMMLLLYAVAQAVQVPNSEELMGIHDLVAQTCTNASSIYKTPHLHISQEFCEAALRSDKRSIIAKHPRDLVLIAIDLVQHGAAKAEAKVNDTNKQKNHSPDTTLVLQYCHLDYNTIVNTVPVCRMMVLDASPWFGHYYYQCAKKLKDAADDCHDNLYYVNVDDQVRKVLWNEAVEIYRRATLLEAMMYVTFPPDTY